MEFKIAGKYNQAQVAGISLIPAPTAGWRNVLRDLWVNAGAAVIVTLKLGVDVILDSATDASTFAAGTIGKAGKTWGTTQYVGKEARITGGTGVGQMRTIASHTDTVLTISPNWTVTPDATSDFEIVDVAAKLPLRFPAAGQLNVGGPIPCGKLGDAVYFDTSTSGPVDLFARYSVEKV